MVPDRAAAASHIHVDARDSLTEIDADEGFQRRGCTANRLVFLAVLIVASSFGFRRRFRPIELLVQVAFERTRVSETERIMLAALRFS